MTHNQVLHHHLGSWAEIDFPVNTSDWWSWLQALDSQSQNISVVETMTHNVYQYVYLMYISRLQSWLIAVFVNECWKNLCYWLIKRQKVTILQKLKFCRFFNREWRLCWSLPSAISKDDINYFDYHIKAEISGGWHPRMTCYASYNF